MSNTPTILVKKADGSMVKMTMEEFKLYKQNMNSLKADSMDSDNKKQITPTDLPMVLNTEALATTSPVKEVFVNEARAMNSIKTDSRKQIADSKTSNFELRTPNSAKEPVKTKKWNEEDYQSLLENTVAEKSVPTTNTPQSKNEQLVDTIISNLPFKIGNGLLGRLRSLVLSRLKEIRDDEQVLNYATRSQETGGLGLAELAAGDLVNLIKKYLPSKSKLVSKAVAEEAETETPVTATKMAPAKVYFPEREVKKPEVVGKQIVQDVIAPVVTPVTTPITEEKRSVGPVEEFKFMTLVDFRRLAVKPEEATNILKEKLAGLKMESYLLYSQALAGWFASPLYNQYCEVFKKSLNEKKKISDLLLIKEKDVPSLAEFKVLLEFCRGLNR